MLLKVCIKNIPSYRECDISGVNGNINKDYNRLMHTAANGPGAVHNFMNKPDSISINGKAGIHYYYDAAGNQLRKQIDDYTPGANPSVKNYLYIAGFVYLNDTLQYIQHEEGSIRYVKKVNSSSGAIYYAYEYNYFIKDHQGNVRTVLTEGRDTATYSATMETKDSVVVQALFKNVYESVRTVGGLLGTSHLSQTVLQNNSATLSTGKPVLQ